MRKSTLPILDASAAPSIGASAAPRAPDECASARTSARRFDFSWTSAGALATDISAWRNLAESAVEPNPVYGANFLIAAERHLRGGKPIRILAGRDAETGALVALAPVDDRGWRDGFPGRAYEMFVNPYVTLTHPLVHGEYAEDILSALLDVLAGGNAAPDALHIPFLTERRGFHAALLSVARRHGLSIARVDGFSRAAVEPEPGKGGAAYAQNYVSKSRRSNNDRRLRRLRESGEVAFRSVFVCEPGGREALDMFLELERASWKGASGTALLSRESTRDFAHEAFSGHEQAPRVRIRSLTFDERPIAMALDLESQGVVYAFKAAYDEAFAHYSPGLMLDAHTATEIGDDREIKRLDSFAQTEVAQAAVWRQEEPVARVVVSLTAKPRRAETLARRLHAAAAAREHAKRYARSGREVAARGVAMLGGERRALIAAMVLASLPAISLIVKSLI